MTGAYRLEAQPEALIAEARMLYQPVSTICLFSGGHDSSVLAHRCRDAYDKLAFVDTGTAVPGVVEHVEEFAAWLRKPLVIMQAGDAYRRMVLGGHKKDGTWEDGHGFPGPGHHSKAYTRLKERQIEALLKREKAGKHRHSKVLFLSGIRRAESARRSNREPITNVRRWRAGMTNRSRRRVTRWTRTMPGGLPSLSGGGSHEASMP